MYDTSTNCFYSFSLYILSKKKISLQKSNLISFGHVELGKSNQVLLPEGKQQQLLEIQNSSRQNR